MENKNNFMKILQYYSNKFFYSWFFPIILAIISYLIYSTKKINIILLIIINIIISLYWLIRLIIIPKNKTWSIEYSLDGLSIRKISSIKVDVLYIPIELMSSLEIKKI